MHVNVGSIPLVALLLVSAATPSNGAFIRSLLRRRAPITTVVLDADGTTLNPQHEMTPTVAASIQEARDAGLQVLLATGRARAGPWVQDVLEPHNLVTPGVFLQGLVAYDIAGKKIVDEILAPSAIERIEAACAGDPSVTVCAYCRNDDPTTTVSHRLITPCLDGRSVKYSTYDDAQCETPWDRASLAAAAAAAEGDVQAPWRVSAAVRAAAMQRGADPRTAVSKLLVLCSSPEAVAPLRVRLEEALRRTREPARVVQALDWTLEILPAGTSKGAAVRTLLRALGVPPASVMAVGDGENDLEMLQLVGYPVAMGNAVASVKKVARHEVSSNAADGVAEAIRTVALPNRARASARMQVRNDGEEEHGPPVSSRVSSGGEGGPPVSSRRLVLAAGAAAATSTRAGVWPPAALAADGGVAAPAAAGVKLSRQQIEAKLAKVPVVALVNEESSPFLTGNGGRVGYLWLDPTEALLELRVLQRTSPEARFKVVTLPEVYFPLVRKEQPDLGGELRLRPSKRQVVLANRALQYNMKEGVLLPTTLDETQGQVPLFYSERVAFEDKGGGALFPFFLVKEDLDAAYRELLAKGAVPPPPGGGAVEGIPIGLVRVATMDGLISQMESGDVDLSKAVIVGSVAAIDIVRQLLSESKAAT